MPYWVYEDKPSNQATVHLDSCIDCNNGAGQSESTNSEETKWHGPFDSELFAKVCAIGTRRTVISGQCCEKEPEVKGTSHVRFQVPAVDESSLSPADLFHHRMLQIYVNVRDSELKYSGIGFLTSVRKHTGVEHAKRALARPSKGLSVQRQAGLLEMTVEAHVVKPEFASLFTPGEIAEAQRRLAAVD